jgi:UDP-2,3-diacylglucosamine pyrophosphatase LpxH
MNLIVISDLHIGADTKLDIFRSQASLASFLKAAGSEATTLIINGDFLDFLAVTPFGVFSKTAASEKVEKIIKANSNQSLWEGFRAFISLNTQNRIEILLGNHDIEMIFEDVQGALRDAMAPSGEGERVQFKTDHVTHLNLKVGGVPIHLEHGFQYDPFNWYNHAKLLGSVIHGSSGETFDLPFGSGLVYDVLNQVTPEHPFVPLIKPEPAVLLLMLALAPRAVASRLGMLPGMGVDNLKIKLDMWRTGQQFGVEQVDRAAGTGAIESQMEQMLFSDNLDQETTDAVIEFLETGGDEAESFGLIGDLKTKGKLYLLRRGLMSLQDDRNSFFDANQKDDFQKALEGILDLGAKVAILGHSHAMKMLRLNSARDPKRSLLYVNTGTWANLLDVDFSHLQTDEGLLAWLDEMDEGKFTPVQIFSCARLVPLSNGGASVSLERWQNDKLTTITQQEIRP